MDQLKQNGKYQISTTMKAKLTDFIGGSADEIQIKKEIKRVFDEAKYAIDPHTAVASSVVHQYQQKTDDQTPTVIVSTASPYKFPETVFEAITGNQVKQPGLPAVKQLNELLQDELPVGIKELFTTKSRQEVVIETKGMRGLIKSVNKRG